MALEIKDGVEYRTISGKKVGPAILLGMDDRYPFNVPHNGNFYGYTADGKSCIGCYEDNLISEWNPTTESPIRTVTRREVAYGDYGRVKVKLAGYNGDSPSHKRWVSLGDFGSQDWNADELRSAAMVLSQLAEFLDEDKGDE